MLLHHLLRLRQSLFGASTSLPGLLQSLFGYDALSLGPGDVARRDCSRIMAMPYRLGSWPPVDARWLIAAGLLVMAVANYWMSQMNLEISPGQVVWPRVMLVVGLSMCFAPANVAAFLYIPRRCAEQRSACRLLRNEGGSVGTSLAQTLQERREQFHALRLGEFLDSFNAGVASFLDQAQAVFLQQTGDPSAAQQLAWQSLENLRQQQASSLAYFDVFFLLAG